VERGAIRDAEAVFQQMMTSPQPQSIGHRYRVGIVGSQNGRRSGSDAHGSRDPETFRSSDEAQVQDAVQFRAEIRFPSSHIAAMTRIVVSVAAATTPPPVALETA